MRRPALAAPAVQVLLGFGLLAAACRPSVPTPAQTSRRLDGRARAAADVAIAEVERRAGVAGHPVAAPDVAVILLRPELVSSETLTGLVSVNAVALAACARGQRGAVVVFGDGFPRALDRALTPLPGVAACAAALVGAAPAELAPWALVPSLAAPDPATLVITGEPDPGAITATLILAGPSAEVALVVAPTATPAQVRRAAVLAAAEGPRPFALRVVE